MRMESTREDKVYGATVVLAVPEKMTMSGWLMTPWQWPITMIQTLASEITAGIFQYFIFLFLKY